MRSIRLIITDVDGVLTDGTVFFDADGRQFRGFSVRDVTALTLWRLAGGKTAVVSGLGSTAVEAMAQQWRCDDCLMWIKNKAKACRALAERHELDLSELAFLGDDVIDVRAMQTVGLGVAVRDAAPEALSAAGWVTRAGAGEGALRELIEAVLRAQGRFDEVVEMYANRDDEGTD